MDGVRQEFRETFETIGPRCPYCQHLHYPDGPSFYDESADNMDCEHCGKEFNVFIYTSTTWTCRPKVEPAP